MKYAFPVPLLLAIVSMPILSAAEEAVEWIGCTPCTMWAHASGNWAGARDVLTARGITIEPTLTWETNVVAAGGVDGEDTQGQRTLADFVVIVDLARCWNWNGALVAGNAQYTGGDSAGRPVGDAQGWSNIASDKDLLQVSELWFQQECLPETNDAVSRRLRFKVGKIDGNADFCALDAAGPFLNSSAGIIPTVLGLPIYPNAATGIDVVADITPWLSLGAMAFT